jgi:hypothetical protein
MKLGICVQSSLDSPNPWKQCGVFRLSNHSDYWIPNKKKYFFLHLVQTYLGPTQSPIQLVPAALSTGVKWPEREANHSPPTSAEVKKA